MKTMKTFLALFLIVMTGTAQVRLTEVFTVDHEKQYIELFAKGSATGINIGDHYIISYLKNRTTGMVTLYLIDFNAGENPFINNSYAVYSRYSGDKVPPVSYTYRTFASTAAVSKYIKPGNSSSYTISVIGNNEDYFSDTQDETAVFLLKKTGYSGSNTSVIDFVTSVKTGGSQATKIGYINASLDSLPVLIHDGVSFDLRPVLVSKSKHVNENLGQSSYNLRLENCIPVWYKDPRTPTTGQFIDDVPTWDAFSFYYLSTGTRNIANTIEHYTFSPSGVIPQTSLSYVSLQTTPPISSSFECYLNFRYLINSAIADIRLSLYADLNGNHLIDAGDPPLNGYQNIIPSVLPTVTHDGEAYYKLNFQLTAVSPTGSMFYPIFIKTEYALNNGSCSFNTIEEILFADIQALPVRLGDFTASYRQSSALLKWNTKSESNNLGFQIERSADMPNRWYPVAFIGTKAKNGLSNIEIEYAFEDEDILYGKTYFYRLHQMDMDGTSSYSPVRSITAAIHKSDVSIYPNPAQSIVTVFYTGSVPAVLSVINTNGQILQQKNIKGGKTDLGKLNRGNYIVRVFNKVTGESVEKKLIVQE
jgi:hypothetical protein